MDKTEVENLVPFLKAFFILRPFKIVSANPPTTMMVRFKHDEIMTNCSREEHDVETFIVYKNGCKAKSSYISRDVHHPLHFFMI